MKINEVIGEWIIMPQTIKPMGLIKKPGGGFDFKNKGNNRANEKAITNFILFIICVSCFSKSIRIINGT